MPVSEAPDDGLLGDRLRQGLGSGAGYPSLPRPGFLSNLLTLGRAGRRSRRDIALGALRHVRTRVARSRRPSPPPALSELTALELLDPATRSLLRDELEQMAVHARCRRLIGPGARGRARALVPLRIVLHRLLSPTLEAQEAYNRATLHAVNRLVEVVAAQQARIAELEDAER